MLVWHARERNPLESTIHLDGILPVMARCVFSGPLQGVQPVRCYLLFLKVEERWRLHNRRTSCSGNRMTERRGMLHECNMMRTCPESRSMLTARNLLFLTDG